MNVEAEGSSGGDIAIDTLDETPISSNPGSTTTPEASSSSTTENNSKGKEPEEEEEEAAGGEEQEEEFVGAPPQGGAAEEKEKINEVFWENKDLKIGDEWYLVPSRWIRSWQDYVGWKNEPEGSRPDRIDNSGLLMEGTRTLRGQLSEGTDYDSISSECWQLFRSWYGGGPEIKRRVVKMNGQPTIEIVPLRLCIVSTSDLNKETWIEFSKHATVGEFKSFAQSFYKLEPKTFRVWDWHQKRNIHTLDDDKQTLTNANIVNNQHVLIEIKKNGVWTLQSSSYNTYARYNVPTKPGLTGLINLGNTCFMNSSLQCLSNSVPLSNYFLTEGYKQDLNEKNPLGTAGDLAEEYYGLLKQIWGGNNSAVAPSDLKRVVGKFAPQFSGYNQHDSQELLGFILDRLHEDINRVKVKPYVETQESNGRPDAIVAEEQWAAYRKRNDSMIVDYFQGQLKSELVCPDCNKVSVTFDPVMYLSLPLPIEKNRDLEVIVYWWDSSKLPTSYKITVPKDGSAAHIRKEVAKVTGIKESTIQIKEIYNHYFYKDFVASDPVSKITDRDILIAFELPELESFKVEVTEEELERRRKRKQDKIDERNRR